MALDEFCRKCGVATHAHTGMGTDQELTPGAVTLCLGCVCVSVVYEAGGELWLRDPTRGEREELERSRPFVQSRDALVMRIVLGR